MTKIRMRREYAGWNTGEQRIYPGDYDSRDKRLFGIAKYLLDNDFADVIVEAAYEVDDPVFVAYEAADAQAFRFIIDETEDMTRTVPQTPEALNELNRHELQAIVKNHGIDVDGTGKSGHVTVSDMRGALLAFVPPATQTTEADG
jgi:hypothetical protein